MFWKGRPYKKVSAYFIKLLIDLRQAFRQCFEHLDVLVLQKLSKIAHAKVAKLVYQN